MGPRPQEATVAILDLMRREPSQRKAQQIPGVGLTPTEWVARVRAEQPVGYADATRQALAMLRGYVRALVENALAANFPNTWTTMQAVAVNVFARIVREQARVYAGDPCLSLVRRGDVAPDEQESALAARVAGFVSVRKMVEANRTTRAARRGFVRVTWSAERREPVLTIFAPACVFPLFATDDRTRPTAVMLEVSPTYSGTERVARYEVWTTGEEPQTLLVDAMGRVESVTPNPYRDDAGRSIVPVAGFSDDDEDAGYWLPPSDSLMTSSLAADVAWTNLLHVQKLQGFGQWVANPTSENPGLWAAPGRQAGGTSRLGASDAGSGLPTLTMGPDVMLAAPRGWAVQHIAQTADLAQMRETITAFLGQIATMESVPAGTLLAESREASSGLALAIERLPLAELRADQAALYAAPTEWLLTLARIVWDAHQPTNATRLGAGWVGHFEPGTLAGPPDAAQAEQVRRDRAEADAAEVRLGTSSPARILVRDLGLSLEEARAQVAAMAEEVPERESDSLGRRFAGGMPTPLADAGVGEEPEDVPVDAEEAVQE